MAINFHAFTDADGVCSGLVRQFKLAGSQVTFHYSYSWSGVNVEGSFTGKLVHDQISGVWDEKSKDAIGGKKAWGGKATFIMHLADNRRTLVGVWGLKTGKMTDRWIVDVDA